jgi:large subunit ribosomal protein L35
LTSVGRRGFRRVCLKILLIYSKGDKMPKLKTKSSVKKRFKTSSSGKLIVGNVGKRHGMSKRTNSFIRNSKGTRVLSKSASIIIESMMPYSK